MDGMDVGESRKRPLDSDSDHSLVKRSNHGPGTGILLKQLIPSHLVGVILGKGGETVISLQAATGANIKISKGNDFYPGTSDRICVITGSVDGVSSAHKMIWQKIRDRVNSSEKDKEELKIKVVVPNATVGMIIGKGGAYIKQMKEETGAFVQITQKSQDTMLVERVVTIAGTTDDQMSQAFEMVFNVIANDPQSGSCPNITYSDVSGPVANANPNGSPFAGIQSMDMSFGAFSGGNALVAPPCNMFGSNAEVLRITLRNSGYSIPACEEISSAMCTLAHYGLLNTGMSGLTGFGFGMAAAPASQGITLDYLVGIMAGRVSGGGMPLQPKLDMNNGAGYGSFSMGGGCGGGVTPLSQSLGGGDEASSSAENITKELQINESIVGAVLGHGGRAIAEIQRMTTATIQISKKGVFAPGTKNRIATITGAAGAVERASYLVLQCIQQEEVKRAHEDQRLAKF